MGSSGLSWVEFAFVA